MRKFLLLCFILFTSIVNAHDKLALVIGNSDYEHINKLTTPKEETKAISKKLERLGFTVYHYNDLTNIEMSKKIKEFHRNLLKASSPIAFFYYSGHGSQIKKEAYLIPINVNTIEPENIRFNAIKVEEVLGYMSKANTYANILFLDACRDVPLGTKSSANKGLGRIKNMTSKSLIISSTKPGRTARDNRLFNQISLKKLSLPKPLLLLANEIGIEVDRETKHQQIPTVTIETFPNIILGSASSGDTVEIDNLLYQNQPFTKNYYWEEAKEYCEDLKIEEHTNWRLPTQKELSKLSDIPLYKWENQDKWTLWINANAEKRNNNYFIKDEFIDNLPKNSWFWSSNNISDFSAYGVSFSKGITNAPIQKKNKSYVLCVQDIKKEKEESWWKFWE